MPQAMAVGGGAEVAPATPAKRGMGWRLWAIIAVIVIVIIAGSAYYLTRAAAPHRDSHTLVYYMQSEPVTMESAYAYELWCFEALHHTRDTLIGYYPD